MSSRTLVLSLCMVALCGVASAQNQVYNPDFNSDLTGWGAPVNGTFIRVTTDAHDGNPDSRPSGSGFLTHTGADGTQAWGRQCIETPFPSIFAGRTVKFGSRVRETGPGFAQLVLHVFDGPGCTGTILMSLGSGIPAVDSVFQTVSGSYVHPSGTASWEIDLVLTRQGIGSLTANFDEMFILDCDPGIFDLNRDGNLNATDLVLGANRLVANVSCLPQ